MNERTITWLPQNPEASTLVTDASYNATAGQVIAANTYTNPISINLPASPLPGDPVIVIYDSGANSTFNGFATNNLTVLRNSSTTINGVADDVYMAIKGQSAIFEYMASGWRVRNGG